MQLSNLSLYSLPVEAQLHSCTNVFGGTGIINYSLIITTSTDYNVPSHRVIDFSPVSKIRAIGSPRTSLYPTVGHTVSRWQRSRFPVPNRKRQIIPYRKHFCTPFIYCFHQHSLYFRKIIRDISYLAGIGKHIVQLAFCIQAELLVANTYRVPLMCENHPIWPVRRLIN